MSDASKDNEKEIATLPEEQDSNDSHTLGVKRNGNFDRIRSRFNNMLPKLLTKTAFLAAVVFAIKEVVDVLSNNESKDNPTTIGLPKSVYDNLNDSVDKDSTETKRNYPSERSSPCEHEVSGYERKRNGKTEYVKPYKRGGKET